MGYLVLSQQGSKAVTYMMSNFRRLMKLSVEGGVAIVLPLKDENDALVPFCVTSGDSVARTAILNATLEKLNFHGDVNDCLVDVVPFDRSKNNRTEKRFYPDTLGERMEIITEELLEIVPDAVVLLQISYKLKRSKNSLRVFEVDSCSLNKVFLF